MGQFQRLSKACKLTFWEPQGTIAYPMSKSGQGCSREITSVSELLARLRAT